MDLIQFVANKIIYGTLRFNVANLSSYMSFNSMFYFYFQITNFLMDFYLLIGFTFL